MERETGIEPATNGLEGRDSTTELLPPGSARNTLSRGDGGGGWIRTTVERCSADLQSAPVGHLGTPPVCLPLVAAIGPSGAELELLKAGTRIRTADLLLTRQPLYH